MHVSYSYIVKTTLIVKESGLTATIGDSNVVNVELELECPVYETEPLQCFIYQLSIRHVL